MRMLYVCADPGIPLDGAKGSSVHVRQTIAALARQGHEVTVLAARPPCGAALPARVLHGAPPHDAAASSRDQGPVAHETGAIASAHRLAEGAPVSRGQIDLVYERYSLWSLAGAALAERLKAPFALEVNAPLVEEQSRYRRLALTGLASAIERSLARRADVVICVSSPLCDRFGGLRGERRDVHLFPNAVDTDLFRPRDQAAAPPGGRAADGITFIFVGSLRPWHGLRNLVEAFAMLPCEAPPARLLVVGDGPEWRALQELAAQRGVASRITFTGAVAHERVPSLLESADIAISPCAADAGSYFSPMKLGEYLAAGLAVIAADRGDLAGLLREEDSALLVAPGDAAALCRAMRRLAADPDLRRRLALGGRRLAVERLSLEAASARLSRLLEDLGSDRRCAASPGDDIAAAPPADLPADLGLRRLAP